VRKLGERSLAGVFPAARRRLLGTEDVKARFSSNPSIITITIMPRVHVQRVVKSSAKIKHAWSHRPTFAMENLNWTPLTPLTRMWSRSIASLRQSVMSCGLC
jgi:hypothetical protein